MLELSLAARGSASGCRWLRRRGAERRRGPAQHQRRHRRHHQPRGRRQEENEDEGEEEERRLGGGEDCSCGGVWPQEADTSAQGLGVTPPRHSNCDREIDVYGDEVGDNESSAGGNDDGDGYDTRCKKLNTGSRNTWRRQRRPRSGRAAAVSLTAWNFVLLFLAFPRFDAVLAKCRLCLILTGRDGAAPAPPAPVVTFGVGVMAAPCAPAGSGLGAGGRRISVSPRSGVNLSSVFACEGGEFDVSWSGEVGVPDTIYIGRGTTVRIVGEIDAAGTRSTGGGGGGGGGSGEVAGDSNDMSQRWIEALSSRLPPLPNGLPAAAVGTAVLATNTNSTAIYPATVNGTGVPYSYPRFPGNGDGVDELTRPTAPMFFVDGGQLFLENLAVRGGYTANSTSFDPFVYTFPADDTVADGAGGNSTSMVVVSGGAVHAVDSNVTVTGCEFEDHFAEHWGGGIFVNRSSLVVRGSVFRRCQAGLMPKAADEGVEGAGGGIGAEFTDVLIDGCLFEKCFASKKGGGMHQGVGQITVVDSLFYNNTAGSDNVEADEPIGEGAALSLTVCTRSFDGLAACGVNDTVFTNHHVARKGGTVAIGSGRARSAIEFHRCTVDNSTTGSYIEDDPQGEGGAFAVAQNTTLLLADCLLRDNYCGKKGGVVTLSSGDDWETDPGGVLVVSNSTFTGNRADLENAGVVYVGDRASLLVEGNGNIFARNECGADGAVIGATGDTRVVVEGGEFFENKADDGSGGVIWTKGNLSILGGYFSDNRASDQGGVVIAGEDATVTLAGGTFRGNEALDGGAVNVAGGAALMVKGGHYDGNLAGNGGGVFAVEDGGNISIIGGSFRDNKAAFGGFLWTFGAGDASCTGAATTITGNSGVDGGAVYAFEGAKLDWGCDLVNNSALTGPAIYARAKVEMVLRGVQLNDNVVARGSVVFVVDSILHTYQVVLNDSSRSEDLSAVQANEGSTFKAEDTSFVGFAGEAVVFSEGILYLDDCDFSGSTAAVLVSAGANSTAVIRNTVLGDSNYLSVARAASRANQLPKADSLADVDFTCDGWARHSPTPPCSEGSPCLDGDLGVYCQCYKRESTGDETCVDGDSALLSLTALQMPDATFFPDLLEGDLSLALGPLPAALTTSTTTTTPSSNSSSSGEASAIHTGVVVETGTKGGVVWSVAGLVLSPSASASPESEGGAAMEWTVFPAAGLLLPGRSVTLRVASLPSENFDGQATVRFEAEGMFPPAPSAATDSEGGQRGGSDAAAAYAAVAATPSAATAAAAAAAVSFDVSFYHCSAGNFWEPDADGNGNGGCGLCSDLAQGDVEGLDCESPGVTTQTLPIKPGFWRASLDSVVIRQCANEDACRGGSAVTSEQDYCNSGYEGPQCAVCAPNYGRGVADTCHACTATFKAGMYFVLAVCMLLTLIVAALLAVYLVGGRGAVNTTVTNTRQSVRMLQKRGSGLLRQDISAGSSAEGNSRGGKAVGRGISRRVSVGSWGISKSASIRGAPQKSPATTGSVPEAAVGRAGDREEEVVGRVDSGCPANEVVVASAAIAASTATASSSSAAGSATAATAAGDSASCKGEDGQERSSRSTMFSGSSGHDLLPSAAPAVRGGGLVGGGGGGRVGGKDKKKTAAARIGEVLAKLPLSKLKIVIVVWQISSAFSDITKVPFPPVYEKFLSIIGIFSFDLGWMISAACLTAGIDFYDKLLIITIGPVGLLLLLGVTFYLGARPVRKGRFLPGADSTATSAIVSANTSANTLPFLSRPPPKPTRGTPAASTAAASSDSIHRRRSSASTTAAPHSDVSSANPSSTVAAAAGAVLDVEDRGEGSNDPSAPASPLSRGKGSGERAAAVTLRPRPSARRTWRNGPGASSDLEQNHLWQLFARHTTMTLIILYLVYTQVSTVVFQAFACEDFPEVGKSFLRADFRIECGTSKHEAYKIYAAVMICIYPLGIPAAFCYFLVRQKSRINPPTDERLKDSRGTEHVMREKLKRRKADLAIAPTSFLWNAYHPNRYYFEVFECLRRLLLTGLLVFLVPDTPGQVAFGCVFAFLSLMAFELLRPHVDRLDMQLYRTGCLVIFFTNFLGLMISAKVANPNSRGSAVYSVVLIVANVLFFLSIFWNTWAAAKASFSRRHVQNMVLGVDLLKEDHVDKFLGPMKRKEKKKMTKQEKLEEVLGPDTGSLPGREAKMEDLEAPPAWEADPDRPPESPVDISSRTYRRGLGGQRLGGPSETSTVGIPSTFWGATSLGEPATVDTGGALSASGRPSVSDDGNSESAARGGGGVKFLRAWGDQNDGGDGEPPPNAPAFGGPGRVTSGGDCDRDPGAGAGAGIDGPSTSSAFAPAASANSASELGGGDGAAADFAPALTRVSARPPLVRTRASNVVSSPAAAEEDKIEAAE